ncbi:MAG: PAS domain S-box protein, partial [Deltaproteobacteria bacterium]|nr:PAS domain S-box protein [Deltaproteobacteria bacterium]
VSANIKILKTLEIDWEELEGTSLDRFLPPDKRPQLREKLAQAINEDEIEPYELELINTSGDVIPVELSINAVRNRDKVFGLHIISRDIAKRKRMERQVIQASKLAAVGELASGVAHEINNPIASVAGYAEEMLDLITEMRTVGAKDLNEFKDALTIIVEQAHRCKEITQGLLNFARQGEFGLVPTRVNALIEKTILLVEPDIKMDYIKIFKDLEADLPMVETDPSQIQQVFLNILKNAIDAVEPGGAIHVRSRVDNDMIQIQFKDNGIGIPNEHLKKVFDPFFTTKPPGKGTGLGLSICYSIMEKLKGSIEIKSHPDSGTTLTVNVPYKWNDIKDEGELT